MFSFWNSKPVEDLETWIDWQNNQTDEHYYDYAPVSLYLQSQKKNFFPKNSVVLSSNRHHYWYCFGVFTPFILHQNVSSTELMELCINLLEIYDHCKGYFRTLMGDNYGISVLRTAVATGNLKLLKNFDYEWCFFDPKIVHAHTVAHYSLSCLFLRIIGHALFICGATCPAIEGSNCEQSFSKRVYAKEIKAQLQATLWDFDQIRPFIENSQCSLWYSNRKYVCTLCARECENLWGNYYLCLDCFRNKACNLCGKGNDLIRSKDGMMYCHAHLD